MTDVLMSPAYRVFTYFDDKMQLYSLLSGSYVQQAVPGTKPSISTLWMPAQGTGTDTITFVRRGPANVAVKHWNDSH